MNARSDFVVHRFGVSVPRTWLIAGNTWREAVRQKLFSSLLLLALALVLGARGFREFNYGLPELKFIADCGLGALAFFGSVLAIVATAQLFFAEVENRTVLTLLAKPVRRLEFVLGKFLGVAGVLAAFCAVLTLLLMAVLWFREGELMREHPDAFQSGRTLNYATVAWAGTTQWLKLTVLAAGTLLVATFAQTQLFTMVMGFLLLVIAHLQPLAQAAWARGGDGLGRVVTALLAAVFPNFQLFAAEPFAPGVTGLEVARIVAYGSGYAALLCMLAVFSFGRREI